MRTLVLATLVLAGAAGAAADDIRDIDGITRPLLEPVARANLLVFVMTDCPISNAYAPEVQRTCRDYAARGVDCALVYEDLGITKERVRAHLGEYAFRGMPAVIDEHRDVAAAVGVSVTPTAVLVDDRGRVRYRGRVDNLYASLGTTRRRVTERYVRDALDALLDGRPVPVPETPAIGCHIAPANTLGGGGADHASH